LAEIRLEKIVKRFHDGSVAVDNLDLSISDGEFLTLLGPSGCGKTTTLRMIAGLETPTEGAIWFGDRFANDIPPAQRNLAMVFQSYALYPHMTVRSNLDYPLRKAGLPREERARRIKTAAALLQIEPLLDRKPRALSGGQQQRVALGRAIVRDPNAFLLDEPMSNLDAKLRAYMRVELIELHRRLGKTMIYVTHDQFEAMTMSDRIAVMNKGRLQQIGTPAEIYNRPANHFVASFIGAPEMNFVDGTLSVEAGSAVFRCLAFDLPVPAGTVPSAGVTLGVRPEDVLIGDGPYRGEVRVIEPTGHETLVRIDVKGQTLMSRIAAHMPVGVGQNVDVGLRASRLYFFDKETGNRIGGDK
jgi:multiple sugar transport system ATP-binding protein